MLAAASTMKRGETSVDAPDAQNRLALFGRLLACRTAERARHVIDAEPTARELIDSPEIEAGLRLLRAAFLNRGLTLAADAGSGRCKRGFVGR